MSADLTHLPLDAVEQRGRSVVLCQVCGEPLTDPVSRRWAAGPDCRRKLRLTAAPRPGRFDVDQEQLPGV